MKTKILFTILTILLCSTLSFAQPGTLDLTFDPGTGADNIVFTSSIQSDGKIIIGGVFDSYNGMAKSYIARLNTNGSIDNSFDYGTGADGGVSYISVQSDGKIIISGGFTSFNGTARNRIARLNIDGSLDTSFDTGTGVNDHVGFTAIQSDGKIIIGGLFTSYNGTARNRIARLNTDGSLDTSFDPGMGANEWVYTSSIQNDGKIIIGGFFTTYNGTVRNRIARLNTDGTLDISFDPGTGLDDHVLTTTIQSDGKIIIGGFFTTYNGTERESIARLNDDGSLDSSFNPGTSVGGYSVYTTSIQSDGKFIIGGEFTSYNGIARNRIARLNTNGSLDTSFNPGTGANGWVRTTTLQSDGNIIIGGEFTSFNGTVRNRIARILASGSSSVFPVYNENETRFTFFPNPFSTQTTLQSDYFIHDGTLTIYNSLGEAVTQINNINGQSVTINRSNLANGLYFIRLTEGKHELMLKKVMVVD